MRTIKLHDTQNDVGQESDHEDQGSSSQGTSFIAPPTAPSAQVATIDGEPKGANKRTHGTIVTSGHKVHATRAQRMSQTDNDNQSGKCATTPIHCAKGDNQKARAKYCYTSKTKFSEHSSCTGNYRHRRSDGSRRSYDGGYFSASHCSSSSCQSDISTTYCTSFICSRNSSISGSTRISSLDSWSISVEIRLWLQ
jgi:hypothetical protein